MNYFRISIVLTYLESPIYSVQLCMTKLKNILTTNNSNSNYPVVNAGKFVLNHTSIKSKFLTKLLCCDARGVEANVWFYQRFIR